MTLAVLEVIRQCLFSRKLNTENMELKYEIEADWILLTTCNFRCSYCFFSPSDLGAKMVVQGTNEQWAEGFNATGKTWLLHITGGEPTIYPDFVGLCEQLSRNHYLSINSNISHQCIDSFAERIDPKRVHFINASVHYDVRQKKAGIDAFIERVQKLRRHDFTVLVSAVMTPKMVVEFPEISKYFESHGVALIPKVLRGTYLGKKYPSEYSKDEESLILEYLAESARKYAPIVGKMGESATIDMLSDGPYLKSKNDDYRGKLCGSGYNFVKIEIDGTVVQCGAGRSLGNILLNNVTFQRAPQACETSYCPYFCKKYTSPQFTRMCKREGNPFITSLFARMRKILF